MRIILIIDGAILALRTCEEWFVKVIQLVTKHEDLEICGF